MLQEYEGMIKIVVDLRRRFLSGGGEMHADCDSILLEDGSEQDDLWGANWYPSEQRMEFESMINIRPRLGNRNILIQADLLDEAKHMIEWTAAETEPETASELVRIQTMISLWQRAWNEASQHPRQLCCFLCKQRIGLIRPWIFRGWCNDMILRPQSRVRAI